MTHNRDESAGLGATSLYEERLVEDLLLLRDVLAACARHDDQRLVELGVLTSASR